VDLLDVAGRAGGEPLAAVQQAEVVGDHHVPPCHWWA
jgi:hypothetical protein